LRGYPSRALVGKDMVATNLEYRSRPVEIASIQFGAAAFYDVGDAFDGFDHMDPKHAVGFGLRAVFPQIERAVLRFDVGFPVQASHHPLPDHRQVDPVSFFLAFNQALSLPVIGSGFGP
jgi:outer membrane translocation and assembly module TamA